ncbi:MAG TPA: hypothetical protein VGE31_00080 [Candidatus Paceibacterota bacterium]
MSTPPGWRPPGWRRPRGIGLERDERQAHTVGMFLKGMHEAEETKQAKRKPSATHLKPFRSRDGRLRQPNGKWAKDPTPNHKRVPPIRPWNKGKKTGPRRAKK